MEKQHTVTTAPALTINTLPEDHVLPIGSNVTVTCTSNTSRGGFGDSKYQMPYLIEIHFVNKVSDIRLKRCGGRRSDREKSKVCSYVIHNASRNDSGNYSCWTRNSWTCTMGSIQLDFKDKIPPVFTVNPPVQMLISSGGKASMTCKASGFPIPLITWFKDWIPVPRANTTGEKGLSILTLEFVKAVNQGKYWCEANNSVGWQRSLITKLMLSQVPTISIHPKNVFVSFKENITLVSLACKATGSPSPVVTWLKNNSTWANATVVETDGISWLILVLVKNVENGSNKYNCVARNIVGKVYSNEATVINTQTSFPEAESNVISFYRHPASLAASPGDHVIFTCAVEGSPAPSIIWLKDGLKVVDDEAKNYQGRESTISELHILDVQEHHAGNYACKAANAMGSDVSRNALLSLTGKPDSAKRDTSPSPRVSLLLWILVAAAAALILVVGGLIFVIHAKHKKAGFNVTKEEGQKEQRYSNLYINN